MEHEQSIWATLVNERRAVSRALYAELAMKMPRLRPRATKPERARPPQKAVPGRRRDVRPNALRKKQA